MIGTSVDRYRIVEEIGHGGMSVVYRGVDTSLERDVAVKVLHHHLARKAESRQRFHREAKAIARLKHPNILDVYDFSSEDAEKSFIIMEFVRGLNLREFLATHGAGPPEAAALVGWGICSALVVAHEHGIIHRDLKPENVMISQAGDLKLMDFGIAHVIDAETMTQTGSLMGSPAHMSPEMIEGEKVDARADVFALGTVLYWLSTGVLPFEGQNAPQVLKRVLAGQVEKLTARDARVGRSFQTLVETCMAHRPEDRYQTARDALDALGRYLLEAGIESPEAELRKYLTNPEAWSQAWTETVVSKLITRGRAALEAGQVQAAVADLDRALAYEPDNAEVKRCLASIHRGSQLRVVGMVLVALGVMVGLSVWFWPTTPPPGVDQSVTQTANTALVEPVTVPAQTVAQQVQEDAEQAAAATARAATTEAQARELASEMVARSQEFASSRPKMIVPTVRPFLPTLVNPAEVKTAPSEPATYTYAFRVYPPAAQLVVGGRTYSSFEAAKGIPLESGRHVLTANSRGCKRLRQTIEVSGPQKERQDVVLEWEDGTVRVRADVDSLIFLGDDTRNVARRVQGGQSATFRFPFGASDGQNQVRTTFHIAPASDMTKRQTYSVVVRPGTVETINVAFRNR